MPNLNNNDKFLAGIDEFNTQRFFDCHETLEDVWRKDNSSERELIQGIIQIAVGYYHWLRRNRAGALKLLKRGLERVMKYEQSCRYLNIKRLAAGVSANIEEIEHNHPIEPSAIKLPTIEVLLN